MNGLPLSEDWPRRGVKSISSDVIHIRPEAYLAELLMLNRDPSLRSVPFFWREEKYGKSYQGFVVQVGKHVRSAGFKPVHRAIVKNNLTSLTGKAITLIMEEILGD